MKTLLAVFAIASVCRSEIRGYLTTPAELAVIAKKAEAGVEPYRSAAGRLREYVAHAHLPPPDSGKVACRASRLPVYYTGAAPIAYASALEYRLTGDRKFAQSVRDAIVNLLRITDLEEGDCPLTMGRHIPTWIRAADLIDDYWSSKDKRGFQDWMAAVVFPSLMKKYRRGNNWGAVITNGGQHIADYCSDRRDLKLGGMPPPEAYRLMRRTALDRINGLIWDRCGEGVSMIRPDGGIPEELRRSTTCSDTHIAAGSPAHYYSEGNLAGLIGQAELCLRRGDRTLYDNIVTTVGTTSGGKILPAGRGSIRRAILFVLDQVPWEKKASLMIAARYFGDERMLAAARDTQVNQPVYGDIINQFTDLTHDFAPDEQPGPPPVTTKP